MVDFTSALYLGLRHGRGALGSWRQLTTGAPAALMEPPGAEAVAAALARRMGCRRGLLAPSTLHLFHDVFELLAQQPLTVLLDAGVYPIARWGAERALLTGAPLVEVAHYDTAALRQALARAPARRRPLLVVDGFCPGCGRVAPLDGYLELLRARGGWLVVDDTQALGVLGRDAERVPPYGRGGGGTLPHRRVGGERVLVVASLAKGLGAPLAVAAGGEEWMAQLAEAPTRVHCSPPSAAAIRAAEHGLAVDERHGDALRARLAALVERFRDGLRRIGLAVGGGMFPVQRLRGGADPAALYRGLLAAGVRALILRARCEATPALSFLLTARHRDHEIDAAVAALARLARVQPTRESCIHSTTRSIG